MDDKVILAFVVALGVMTPAQTGTVTNAHGAIVEVNQRNGWYGIVI